MPTEQRTEQHTQPTCAHISRSYPDSVDRAADLSPADLRVVQAIADFQMSLSAFAFMCEVDPDQPISRVERRRLKCFEDAAVIAYWRPFSKSDGLATISLKKLRITPTSRQLALHDKIRDRRNKVIAHTDMDRMRLALSTTKVFDDLDILLPSYDFDDSLHFFEDCHELIVWLRTLREAAAKVVFDLVQGRPEMKFVRDDRRRPRRPGTFSSDRRLGTRSTQRPAGRT